LSSQEVEQACALLLRLRNSPTTAPYDVCWSARTVPRRQTTPFSGPLSSPTATGQSCLWCR
jgi:hypothetical protein